MSSEKFTPGEWRVDIESHGIHIIPNIAWLGEKSSMERKENIANAHLIAAAPEMYQVLKRLIELTDYTELVGILSDAKTILKKARGEK